MTRLMAFAVSPPRRIESSRALPLETLSTSFCDIGSLRSGAQERTCAQQVFYRRDQHERVQRLEQERLRAGGQRLVPEVQARHRHDRWVRDLAQLAAQL